MRPVNLLPSEERRGAGRAGRTGPVPYVIVGVLVLALAGVLALSLFNKQIGDREAEVQALEAKAAETAARAESLTAFVSFQQVHDARVQTVDQLARSRFDWERILRELSLILPRHVWLTSVTGTVAPGVSVEGGDGTGLRDGIEGPALELVGCGRTHNDVARMVAAMRDIDGVTRVTASDSARAGGDAGGGGGGGDGAESSDCRTKPSVTMFHLIAAFDAVPPPPDAGGTAPAPTAPAADEQGGGASSNGSGSNDSGAGGGASDDASAGADGGVAETESQNATARQDAKRAGQRTEKARNLVPGG